MWCNESDEIISFSTDFWSLRTTAATPHKPLPYTLITLSLWSNNPQPVTLYTDLIPEVGCLLESGAVQSGRELLTFQRCVPSPSSWQTSLMM
jgi:hypothetical protein